VRILRSTAADATTWSDVTRNYAAGLANWGAGQVNAIVDSGFGNDLSLVFYKSYLGKPRVIVANAGFSAITNDALVAELDYPTGVYGDGWGSEHMAVMTYPLTHAVVARKSTTNGTGWVGVSLNPGVVTAFSYTTPAIYKYADNTWILCYTKTNLGQSNQLRPNDTDLGRVYYRISLDDGRTWTADAMLSGVSRAQRGLSITPLNPSDFILSYAAANTGRVVFVTLRLVNNSRLDVQESRTGTMYTATEPSGAINALNLFSAREDHWLTPDFATVASRSPTAGSRFADPAFPAMNLDSFSTARPAIAASPQSNTLYMFDVVSK